MFCAAESFHRRKESCHMVYQGSASTDVSLGCCHGFKVAQILSDSRGERITADLCPISRQMRVCTLVKQIL